MSLRPTPATRAVLPLLFAGAAVCLASDKAAQALLERALAAQRSFHAVIVQSRSGMPGRPELLVKIQVVPTKGTKATVLQPITNQGFVSIDDGQEMRVFDPDSDVVLVQPSPNLFLPTNAWRANRIRENYNVSFGERRTVAGRKAREVVMRPRDPLMPERRLTVDDEKKLILRYVIQPAGQPEVVFAEVRSVIFDAREAAEDFRLPSAAGERRVRRTEGPVTVRDANEGFERTGIRLAVPKGLPAGFGVHTTHVVGRDNEKFLAFRTSDGMSFVTVYARKDDGKRKPSRSPDASKVAGGIRISATAMPGEPVPKEVLDRIVQRFADALS